MQAMIPMRLAEEKRKMGASKESLLLEHYLIDTENLGREWTELLDTGGNAVYHIFYTGHSAAIPLESVGRLLQLNGRLRWIKCCTGANALDFQLVTQLGYLLASTPDYKTTIHTELVGVFKQPRGSKMYRACKAIITQAYLNPMLWRAA